MASSVPAKSFGTECESKLYYFKKKVIPVLVKKLRTSFHVTGLAETLDFYWKRRAEIINVAAVNCLVATLQ